MSTRLSDYDAKRLSVAVAYVAFVATLCLLAIWSISIDITALTEARHREMGALHTAWPSDVSKALRLVRETVVAEHISGKYTLIVPNIADAFLTAQVIERLGYILGNRDVVPGGGQIVFYDGLSKRDVADFIK